MRTVISACILWIFLVAGFAAATTYLVKPDGTGDFPTIQAAMDAAAPGDTVDLDDGTFAGPGNRDLSYEGKAILVRPRNGNAADCIIDCGGWGTEPRRDFSTETEGPGSILEAVTITGGCLSQPDVLGDGGAFLCAGTSAPVLRRCVFRQNSAFRGGGLHCGGESTPYLLVEDSPCSEMENSQCGRIGAWGLGCLPAAISESTAGAETHDLGSVKPNPSCTGRPSSTACPRASIAP